MPLSTPVRLRTIALRFILAVPAVVVGGYLGFGLGGALAHAIAALTDNDIAALKDMLIWSMLAGSASAAIAGVWLVLFLTRASRGTQRAALIALAGTVVAGAAMMLASYDWPKSSGIPVVDYELRLPAGTPLPGRGDIAITVWSGRSGQGCSTDNICMADGRPELTGTMVLHPTDAPRTLSLALKGVGEGHWDLPIAAQPKLEKAFGSWRRIEFLPPRGDAVPLAPGGYEIRYRVRRYM